MVSEEAFGSIYHSGALAIVCELPFLVCPNVVGASMRVLMHFLLLKHEMGVPYIGARDRSRSPRRGYVRGRYDSIAPDAGPRCSFCSAPTMVICTCCCRPLCDAHNCLYGSGRAVATCPSCSADAYNAVYGPAASDGTSNDSTDTFTREINQLSRAERAIFG